MKKAHSKSARELYGQLIPLPTDYTSPPDTIPRGDIDNISKIPDHLTLMKKMLEKRLRKKALLGVQIALNCESPIPLPYYGSSRRQSFEATAEVYGEPQTKTLPIEKTVKDEGTLGHPHRVVVSNRKKQRSRSLPLKLDDINSCNLPAKTVEFPQHELMNPQTRQELHVSTSEKSPLHYQKPMAAKGKLSKKAKSLMDLRNLKSTSEKTENSLNVVESLFVARTQSLLDNDENLHSVPSCLIETEENSPFPNIPPHVETKGQLDFMNEKQSNAASVSETAKSERQASSFLKNRRSVAIDRQPEMDQPVMSGLQEASGHILRNDENCLNNNEDSTEPLGIDKTTQDHFQDNESDGSEPKGDIMRNFHFICDHKTACQYMIEDAISRAKMDWLDRNLKHRESSPEGLKVNLETLAARMPPPELKASEPFMPGEDCSMLITKKRKVPKEGRRAPEDSTPIFQRRNDPGPHPESKTFLLLKKMLNNEAASSDGSSNIHFDEINVPSTSDSDSIYNQALQFYPQSSDSNSSPSIATSSMETDSALTFQKCSLMQEATTSRITDTFGLILDPLSNYAILPQIEEIDSPSNLEQLYNYSSPETSSSLGDITYHGSEGRDGFPTKEVRHRPSFDRFSPCLPYKVDLNTVNLDRFSFDSSYRDDLNPSVNFASSEDIQLSDDSNGSTKSISFRCNFICCKMRTVPASPKIESKTASSSETCVNNGRVSPPSEAQTSPDRPSCLSLMTRILCRSSDSTTERDCPSRFGRLTKVRAHGPNRHSSFRRFTRIFQRNSHSLFIPDHPSRSISLIRGIQTACDSTPSPDPLNHPVNSSRLGRWTNSLRRAFACIFRTAADHNQLVVPSKDTEVVESDHRVQLKIYYSSRDPDPERLQQHYPGHNIMFFFEMCAALITQLAR